MEVNTLPISEWTHHSDPDRDSWDRHPEEEDGGRQDEADNRDKGNFALHLVYN